MMKLTIRNLQIHWLSMQIIGLCSLFSLFRPVYSPCAQHVSFSIYSPLKMFCQESKTWCWEISSKNTEKKCRWAKKKRTSIKCFRQRCSTWAFKTALLLLNWRDEHFSSKSFSLICRFWQYFHYHSWGPHVLCGSICCVFSILSLHFFPPWLCQCLNSESGSCLSQTASDADSTQGVV